MRYFYVKFIPHRLNNKSTEDDATVDVSIWGDDNWIGRTVLKDFGEYGKFRGQVKDVDDNANKPGYRVFHVVYEDGDDEWMGPKSLQDILTVGIVESMCANNNILENTLTTNIICMLCANRERQIQCRHQ